MAVSIDFVHDVVCPWCRIGKKNLDDALKAWEGDEVVIAYHPFFLQPGMPANGRNFREHMRSVKGDDNIDGLMINVSNAGLRAGLNFNWDAIQRMPNTLLAHALVLSALPEIQGEVLDAVHAAYFEQGIDIGDKDRLIEIGRRFNLDTARLDDQEFLDDVVWCGRGEPGGRNRGRAVLHHESEAGGQRRATTKCASGRD